MLNVSILNSFPKQDHSKIDGLLEQELKKDHTKLIVLDDDPTGVQTVHDISVFTDWSAGSIREGFNENNKLFYILTNSRGFTGEQTTKVHKEIAAVISKTAKETGRNYLIMSRSDSTLRGHYPLETKILKDSMQNDGICLDGEILCPFFPEGGRFTINNIHYVQQDDMLIPAAETEFAKDKTFAYSHSSIPEYIEEKTKGEYKACDVTCISPDSLRNLELDKIQNQLEQVSDFNKICVNAVNYYDIKVFAIALYRAMASGKTFMFRTAAGLVKVMGGISDIPLLTKKDLIQQKTSNGGLVVVGSHTEKTTQQLNELLKLPYVVPIEFHSDLVLQGDDAFYSEVARCIKEEEQVMLSGKTAVCFTNRTLLTKENDTKEDALLRSVKISDGVQALVAGLNIIPAFIIAKGGITSADIGTKALKVRRANIMGQIKPGIPVWQTGSESKFPFLPYIIFPGNVGTAATLKEVVEVLSAEE